MRKLCNFLNLVGVNGEEIEIYIDDATSLKLLKQ
jgi:hypothetical protein